jgi:hypothetical protein
VGTCGVKSARAVHSSTQSPLVLDVLGSGFGRAHALAADRSTEKAED